MVGSALLRVRRRQPPALCRPHRRKRRPWLELEVALEDPGTGLAARVIYQILARRRCLAQPGQDDERRASPVTLESVTSFLGGGLAGPGGSLDDVDLLWAENDWVAEARWQVRSLRDALPDLNRAAHGARSRGRFALRVKGLGPRGPTCPWAPLSTAGRAIPWSGRSSTMAPGTGRWASTRGGPGSTYLALLAQLTSSTTGAHPRARRLLRDRPGRARREPEGFEGAVARLTCYRRAIRRPHRDHRRLPVIFNDYMNTLMGDPYHRASAPAHQRRRTGGRRVLLHRRRLVRRPRRELVGHGRRLAPSKSRFPNGIAEVLDDIRAEGMVPGLWIEPEVIGARSPVAEVLPRRPSSCATANGSWSKAATISTLATRR